MADLILVLVDETDSSRRFRLPVNVDRDAPTVASVRFGGLPPVRQTEDGVVAGGVLYRGLGGFLSAWEVEPAGGVVETRFVDPLKSTDEEALVGRALPDWIAEAVA